jgi:hypothetical protein
MKDLGKWAVTIAAGFGLLLAAPLPAVSKPAFSKTAIQTAAAHFGKEEVRPCGRRWRERSAPAIAAAPAARRSAAPIAGTRTARGRCLR